MSISEWAAWVQAIGSIVAVIGAAAIAIWQARRQHRMGLELLHRERQSARVDVAHALEVLGTNASKAMQYIAALLKDRDAIHQAAEGIINCDLGEMKRIDGRLTAIPLHELPSSLVTIAMTLSSTVRQFTEKVEWVIKYHRRTSGEEFEDFFRTISAMLASIQATCGDLSMEAERLKKD